MTNQEFISPKPHQISKVAVTIALLTVAAAVVFGIYGPKIADHLTHLGGVPLGDVIEAAQILRSKAILASMQQENGTELNADQHIVSRFLGRTCSAPYLSEIGYHLIKVSPASLPGAPFHSVELIYKNMEANGAHILVVYLLADDGQYVCFDPLGRTIPFMQDDSIIENISVSTDDESMVLIWSDGPVITLAYVDDQQEAEKIQAFIDVP